jgi:putative ABC transport system permease protein
MLTHYLRVAFRLFRRNKLYSLINIACLAIGLAAVMTILLYVLHEHSYDRWHTNARLIFITYTRTAYGYSSWNDPDLSYPVGPAAKAASPAVESFVRIREAFDGVDLQNPASPGILFKENSRFIYADSNFFRFFSFRLLRGSTDAVLARPFTVVLTQAVAKKYFGNSDPVGKTLTLDKQYALEVTGVAADMPSNTSLTFDMVTSLATMRAMDRLKPYLEDQQLESGTFRTWLKLRQLSDTGRVSRELSRQAMATAGIYKKTNAPYGEIESHQFWLSPLTNYHLSFFAVAHPPYLTIFSWMAALILLLALVNYMSLATARSAMRAKEVGVRKVIGAGRRKIAAQFYTESAVYAVIAFAAGALLFFFCRPWFCNLMQVPIDAGFLLSPAVALAFGALLLLVILVSGSYPSILLSSFRPAVVLYGKLSRHRSGGRIRKVFLVFQFTLSLALMTCAFVIGKELHYFRHTDTGVLRENIVMLPFAGTMEHYPSYLKEVSAIQGIRQVATARYKLYAGTALAQLIQVPQKATPDELMYLTADTNFIPMLGLKWKEKPDPASGWWDRKHLVVNEAATDAWHLSGRVAGSHVKSGEKDVTLAGVLRDFNFFSLHTAVAPFGIQVTRNVEDEWVDGIDGVLYVKIVPSVNVAALMEAVHRVYTRYDARTPFEFTFLDDQFDSQYKAEDRLAGLMNIFTVITIVISCLGLFALATFAAEQRLKEIGIRKVLGASVRSISVLLSRDFLQPILLSVLIASPLAGWTMHRWLQNFAYRTPISWWIFPVTAAAVLLVAQLTVLVRTIRAARANPSVNLRSE